MKAKREQQSQKELRSFEEYRKTFFPKLHQEETVETDPKQLGRILAERAFQKLRPILKGIV
jgi:hypothetical protein